MKKTVFAIQPKSGGPVVRCDALMSAEVGAKYALRNDLMFKRLDKDDALGAVVYAKALLSACYAGVIDVEKPDLTNFTLNDVFEFSDNYEVGIETPDIPEEAVEENPTATRGATS